MLSKQMVTLMRVQTQILAFTLPPFTCDKCGEAHAAGEFLVSDALAQALEDVSYVG